MFCLRSSVLCFMIAGSLAIPAAAQYRSAFSQVTFYGGLQSNVNETLLHQYWSVERGVEVVIGTPLSFGEGEVGASVQQWNPATPSLPNVDAVLAFAGWSAVFEPVRYVQLQGGVRIGAHRMSFDVDTFQGAQDETEVVLGAQTRLRISPVPWAGLFVGASYMQTYTYVRMKLAYVSFGIHATLQTPRWLQTVLR